MGKTFEQGAHEPSADAFTAGGRFHPDADQLEVSSQPFLGKLGVEHLERVVGPPLAELTRVAVGEADEDACVVRASESKAGTGAVLVPDSPAPGLVVGVVTEDRVVDG